MPKNPTPSRTIEASNAPQPAIIVIFGVTGDLARRYLMPSLYRLFRDELLHEKTEIVGISRRNVYLDDLFNTVEMCVNEVDKVCDPVTLARMHSRTRIHQLDMDDPAAYKGLLEALNGIEAEQGVCMNRLYYPICRSHQPLTTRQSGTWAKPASTPAAPMARP